MNEMLDALDSIGKSSGLPLATSSSEETSKASAPTATSTSPRDKTQDSMQKAVTVIKRLRSELVGTRQLLEKERERNQKALWNLEKLMQLRQEDQRLLKEKDERIAKLEGVLKTARKTVVQLRDLQVHERSAQNDLKKQVDELTARLAVMEGATPNTSATSPVTQAQNTAATQSKILSVSPLASPTVERRANLSSSASNDATSASVAPSSASENRFEYILSPPQSPRSLMRSADRETAAKGGGGGGMAAETVPKGGEWRRVSKVWEPKSGVELKLEMGATVILVHRQNERWGKGHVLAADGRRGRTGLFPLECTAVMSVSEAALLKLNTAERKRASFREEAEAAAATTVAADADLLQVGDLVDVDVDVELPPPPTKMAPKLADRRERSLTAGSGPPPKPARGLRAMKQRSQTAASTGDAAAAPRIQYSKLPANPT